MRRTLLPLLCCPSCRGDLALRVRREEGEVIEEGALECAGCFAKWPIVRGVPRFVPRDLEHDKQDTAQAFGYEWTRFSELRPEYERQFLDWIAPVESSAFEGRLVLDAGCGKGRHLACAARFGAQQAVGVDLSDAVESASTNTRDLPNAHVVQADLYRLPFKDAAFDVAYSVGVLHHLPDPAGGFRSVLGRVKPGGRMIAWVYGRENNGWIVHVVSPLREAVTSRMPHALLRALSLLPTLLIYLAVKLVYRPLSQRAPGIWRRLWYADYLTYLARFSFREIHSIVFDHLVAPTAFYLTQEEFTAWFERAGLNDVIVSWHNRNSWRGTGLKPPA